MRYWLIIESDGQAVNLDFGDNEASRGVAIAGLRQSNAIIKAYDDDGEKLWEKEL